MSLGRPVSLLRKRTVLHGAHCIRASQRRWLATPVGAADAATLPLAGTRVLDMTRVLAGVCTALYINVSLADSIKPYCTQILGTMSYISTVDLSVMSDAFMI
jgi:hypothetical protein